MIRLPSKLIRQELHPEKRKADRRDKIVQPASLIPIKPDPESTTTAGSSEELSQPYPLDSTGDDFLSFGKFLTPEPSSQLDLGGPILYGEMDDPNIMEWQTTSPILDDGEPPLEPMEPEMVQPLAASTTITTIAPPDFIAPSEFHYCHASDDSFMWPDTYWQVKLRLQDLCVLF
jgi:hypothetical protein